MQAVLPMALALFLTGCGPDGSVIYDTRPFFDVEADFSPDRAPAFIRASTDFAERRGLEIAVNEFGNGTFSVLIHDGRPSSLNLTALNTVTRDEIIIGATARGTPTRTHVAIANAWMAKVRPYIGAPRRVSN